MNKNFSTAIADVRQVYAELAQRPIERNCTRQTECCHFKLTGRTPYLTKGEALVAAQGLRATGRKSLPSNPDGACPMLQAATGNCIDLQRSPVRLSHAFLRRSRRTVVASRSPRSHSPPRKNRCGDQRRRPADFTKCGRLTCWKNCVSATSSCARPDDNLLRQLRRLFRGRPCLRPVASCRTLRIRGAILLRNNLRP